MKMSAPYALENVAVQTCMDKMTAKTPNKQENDTSSMTTTTILSNYDPGTGNTSQGVTQENREDLRMVGRLGARERKSDSLHESNFQFSKNGKGRVSPQVIPPEYPPVLFCCYPYV